MQRIVLCALALFTAEAAAREPPGVAELGRARSYGMGGAFRALGAGTEAVEGNPAGMSVRRQYLIELSGAWDPRNPFGFGALSVMDSVTSPLAAGLSYHLVSLGAEDTHRVAHINTGAFSLPFGQVLHVGASVRHVLMTGARSANALTGDAGLLVNLRGLSFAVAGHNLIDIYNPDFPRYFSAGVGYANPLFMLAVDGRANFGGEQRQFAFNAGGEFVIGRVLPIRAGYSWDGLRNAKTIGTGLGLIIENGGLDLSYQHELGGSYSRLLAITFRMQVG